MKDLFGDKIAYIRAAESEVSGSDLHALTTSKESYRFSSSMVFEVRYGFKSLYGMVKWKQPAAKPQIM